MVRVRESTERRNIELLHDVCEGEEAPHCSSLGHYNEFRFKFGSRAIGTYGRISSSRKPNNNRILLGPGQQRPRRPRVESQDKDEEKLVSGSFCSGVPISLSCSVVGRLEIYNGFPVRLLPVPSPLSSLSICQGIFARVDYRKIEA